MTNEQHVLGAVSTNEITSSQGILQRLFALWFDAFVYNQIWEDPRVDIEALEINRESRILTISSGGCNALNYLVQQPASVMAVDLNRYHIYLLRLKIAAARSLPHEAFFNFFARGKHDANLTNYDRHIAPNLDGESRAFWEQTGVVGILSGRRRIEIFSRRGLYDNARNGYFLRFFHKFAHIVGLYPEELLTANSPEEQARLFDENIAPFFDSRFIRLVGRMPITMFGLGIPPQQFDELKQDLAGGTVIDIYRSRARRLACDFPIDENYFAWQAFGRKYDTEKNLALPDYLKPENYDALRDNIHRVNATVGSVSSEIMGRRQGTYNRFVFLDAQDWMNADLMTELWSAIAERGEPGSRIIFRTAAAASPLPKNLPADLLSRFEYDAESSADLFRRDRASIYGGFHLYVLKK